jgi:long-chain acyl-CoA synthetase
VTSSSLTPYMVRGLLDGNWKPSSALRMLTVGGDVLAADDVKRLLDLAGGMEVHLTYGLTEAGPRVSTLAAHHEPQRRWSSVGLPLADVAVSLRHETDGVGELLVTTDTALRRKVGLEEGRASSCFVGPNQIATGDLFQLDDAGYLYYRGRLSDFIVLNGSKVSLASIRRVADALPGVLASSTFTQIDERHETQLHLDMYQQDVSPEAVARTERALYRQLLRVERPHRLRVLPISERGHK